MTRPEFIDDLIPLIFDADEHWWPCHLNNLAKVSRAWLYHARKRLYPYPHIYSFRTARLLADTLAENSLLASLVEGIVLKPEASGGTGRITVEEQKAVRQLLTLEGLARITLGGQLAFRAERYLKLIAYPEVVQEVHLEGKHSFSSTPAEWDETLTFGFASLKKLRLSNIDLHVPHPSIAHPSSISHLILENSQLRYGGIVKLLNGAISLSSLHVTSEDPMDETVKLALSSFSVGCVRYQVKEPSYKDLFAGLQPRHAESLHSLHLDGQFTTVEVLDTISSLFRNLAELVVTGRATYVSPEEWARFIRSGALVSLRRLGLPWGTNRPRFVAWLEAEMEDVRQTCADMNIVQVNY